MAAAEVEIYQAAIAVLALVCAYLLFRYERLKQSVRESQKSYQLPRGNSRVEEFSRQERAEIEHVTPAEEESAEAAGAEVEAEAEKEYTFEDPDFSLPPLLPIKPLRGRVEGEHGDAIYGAEDRYHKEDYIGRVSRGAELELRDCRVYRNEFELNIIKVVVLSNEWQSEIGKTGWVSLDDTSFRSTFDPKKRTVGA